MLPVDPSAAYRRLNERRHAADMRMANVQDWQQAIDRDIIRYRDCTGPDYDTTHDVLEIGCRAVALEYQDVLDEYAAINNERARLDAELGIRGLDWRSYDDEGGKHGHA